MKTAFVNANIVDVIGKRVLEQHALVAEDGLIVYIGTQPDLSDAQIVDLEGKYLMPGLFNAHVHIFSDCSPVQTDVIKLTTFDKSLMAILNCEKLIKTGVTFIRDVGSMDDIAIDLKRNVRSGRLKMAPDMFVCGNSISMTGGACWNVISVEADGPYECMKAARLQLRKGADYVKLYSSGSVLTAGVDPRCPQLTVEELSACVKVTHDAGKKTCCHAQNASSIKNSVIAGVDHIEHGIGADDESIKMMLDKGLWLDPTVSALYNIAKHADGLLPEVAEKALRLEQLSYDTFKKAYAAGVPCGCGNDAGSSYCEFDDTASEMIVMVEKCGLSPMQALEIGTINTARMLDVDDVLGSLELGKKAHMAVFEADPTEDIRALYGCCMTVKNGEVIWKA